MSDAVNHYTEELIVLLRRSLRFLEGCVFVTAMALLFVGSFVWIWAYCVVSSWGTEWRGRCP